MRNLQTLYRALVPRALTWSFCVKSEVKLVGMLLRSVPLVFGQLTRSSVKVVYGYTRNVRRIYKNGGPRGLAIYLKTCYLLLQHSAGGMRDASPWELGTNVARTRKGIPRIINPQHRSLIVKGDVGVIRLWLTLFGLYRVVEFKGALKIGTITDPGVNIQSFREGWNQWVPVFYNKARLITGNKWNMDPTSDLDAPFMPFVRKSSPNSGGFSSVMALPWDILLWGSDPEMRYHLERWIKLTDNIELGWALKPFWKVFHRLARFRWDRHDCGTKKWTGAHPGNSRAPLWLAYRGSPLRWLTLNTRGDETHLLQWYIQAYWGKPLDFGRLGIKEEPGKLRVFAMVNLITQTLLQPLHKWIFHKLRLLPTDGTFNQTAPVERLIKRFAGNNQWVASYDLSAATDRLPLLLQMDLLRPLLGDELTGLWAYFLVGRPYRLPKIVKSYNLGYDMVSYSVGQPMGALSSWALLALTHHALVQYAASRVYPGQPGWFLDYAVLGDDVVIADRLVAQKYLRIMEEIGVKISLAKSLVSNQSSLEFAKRTWVRGQDVTPVSLAEMLVALRNLGSLAELINKNMRFGVIRLASVARFCGFGYRNLARLPVGLGVGNRLSGLLAYLCRPGGPFPMPFEAWLVSAAPGGKEGATDHGRWRVAKRLWAVVVRGLLDRLVRFDHTLYSVSTFSLTEATRLVDVIVDKEGNEVKGATAADRTKGQKKVRLRKPFFSDSVKEFLCMKRFPESNVPSIEVMYNEFFNEWVVRDVAERLRSSFEKIDDLLRVHEPGILPNWASLEDLWTQILEAEDGVNALPSSVEFACRETDEIPPSARLITLWKRLRKLIPSEADPVTDLREGFVEMPKARRRRRGG